MRISHLNALRALEASLRHGSFSTAAEELGITPAAVGQRVRSLEEYIGEDLFERTSAGLVATDKARLVERQLTSGFLNLSGALDQLQRRGTETRLSVTLPASFVENWLSPRISEFYQRHSEVDLRLDASNRDVDLLSESFDFAVRYGATPGAALESVEMFGDHVLPVCAPEFAERHELTPSLRSLKGVPLIHITNRTSDPSWVGFSGWGQAFGFDGDGLRHGVEFSKVSSGLQSAIAGQGLVLCGLVEAFNAVRSGQLVLPFGTALRCDTDYKYRLLWVRGRAMTAVQEDFREWLLAQSDGFRSDLQNMLNERD